MDVEFVTDHDTEQALLAWHARRRRDVVPGWLFLAVVGAAVWLEVCLLWPAASRRSLAFAVSMLLLGIAVTVATLARETHRNPRWRFPHAELGAVGLLVASLVGAFVHHASLLAFVALAAGLVAWAAILVRIAYEFPLLREAVPFAAHAVHVHVDGDGVDVTVRPRVEPRHLGWRAVRSIEGDDEFLFIGTRCSAIVVPRRAVGAGIRWDDLVAEVVRFRTRARRGRGGRGNVRAPHPGRRAGLPRASRR